MTATELRELLRLTRRQQETGSITDLGLRQAAEKFRIELTAAVVKGVITWSEYEALRNEGMEVIGCRP